VAGSPVVQASEESVESLRAAAAHWGEVFSSERSDRLPLASHAEPIAAVYEAFGIAFGALPRFRTEPALRRFMEALQQLERALRDAQVPALEPSLTQATEAAGSAVRHAESAFATLSGKPVTSPGNTRAVRGAVQRLLSDRGYGFLRAEGETSEVFFSAQALRGVRLGELRLGQPVSFRIAPDPRVPGRMHAVDVQPIR
jgi:cold shock CspA family protein